jgi:hypothetical protein
MFEKNDMVRPANPIRAPNGEVTVVYLRETNLGQVIRTSTLDYGQGRQIQKVQVLWLTGDFIGKTSIVNEREIKHAS